MRGVIFIENLVSLTALLKQARATDDQFLQFQTVIFVLNCTVQIAFEKVSRWGKNAKKKKKAASRVSRARQTPNTDKHGREMYSVYAYFSANMIQLFKKSLLFPLTPTIISVFQFV